MTANRFLAAAAAAVTLSPSVALAQTTVASCSPTRVKYMASEALRFRTTSQSFVNLPQARVAFRQGGKNPSCVLVRFSAAPDANRNMAFLALLDGSETALPSQGQISGGYDKGPNVRRFTFIFPSVAPGPHTVQMQYNMTSPGGFADMNAHNTIVQFSQ
jgi:hypothetical protein